MTKQRLWFFGPFLLIAPFVVHDDAKLRAGSYDWPQWRGVHRDAVSAQTGLLKEWPQKGPPLVWKATGLGAGRSDVSVADGRIFTMGERRNPKQPDGPVATFVITLDEAKGKELWSTRIGDSHGDGG